MKQIAMIFFLVLIGHCSIAQHFSLTSNQYKMGYVYVSNPTILFDLGNWTISEKSYNHLDSIANFLLKNDSLIIEIGVHTDGRGSDHYSSRLELKRAESIKAYLIEKGVEINRLSAIGYGMDKLIYSNKEIEHLKTVQEKEAAHAVNRRTEFKIIAIQQ